MSQLLRNFYDNQHKLVRFYTAPWTMTNKNNNFTACYNAAKIPVIFEFNP